MSAATDARRLCPFFAALFVSALVLNWLWEMTQMAAFAEMAGRSWQETALRCLWSSLGDVAITFAIYAVGALAAAQWRWGTELRWNVCVTTALLGAAVAIASEWKALVSRRWSYTGRMPMIPVLEVGLWPVLQLMLLVPLAFGVAVWWTRRTGSGPTSG